MKTLPLLMMLIAIGLSTICCDDSSDRPQFELDTPDNIPDANYKIYSLVFDELFESEQIVILQSSSLNLSLEKNNSFHEMLVKNNQGFASDLLTDYSYQNSQSLLFENNFNNPNQAFTLITNEVIDHFFSGDDINTSWNEFNRSYDSNGFMMLTQIGFNADRTQAIFELSHYYASLGAGGSIIYLEKEGGEWQIKDIVYTWVS